MRPWIGFSVLVNRYLKISDKTTICAQFRIENYAKITPNRNCINHGITHTWFRLIWVIFLHYAKSNSQHVWTLIKFYECLSIVACIYFLEFSGKLMSANKLCWQISWSNGYSVVFRDLWMRNCRWRQQCMTFAYSYQLHELQELEMEKVETARLQMTNSNSFKWI